MSPTVGSRLGSHEILGLLGAGGMGEVFLAEDTKLKRRVAIKVLPAAAASDPDRVARFHREAQAVAALNHPGIAAIYDLAESGGTTFLVLELIDGETLAQRLKRGPLAVDEAVAVARQILDALEAAHEKGICHRDLKPANVSLTRDGAVKVLDFGLAKFMIAGAPGGPADSTLTFDGTSPGVILGTAGYMAPEQAKGVEADQRSDIFSFGCIFYELLSGRYETGRLILAPGSWAPELFKLQWLPLEVEPQQLHWFDPGGGPAPFTPDRFPIYIWDLGNGISFYGFPADDEGRVKVAFFRSRVTGEAALRDALRPCIPALANGTLVETVSCKYTLTPDQHFVIGHHPEFANVVIASPCSGHGYKFATVIGEILADLAIDGATRHPIGLFDPARFRIH